MNNEEYVAKINEITQLMRDDPKAETPEGQRLLALAEEVEKFEREFFKDLLPKGQTIPWRVTDADR